MGRLQRRRDRINQALAASADYVDMTRLARELDSVQAELDGAEDAWLALAVEAAPNA